MKTVPKVALLAICLNIFLFAFKLVMALLSGSVSLLADAIHSSTDIVSSLALYVGLKISNRKTRSFPFGLYKVENLISLGIAFIIFLTGYEIFREVFIAHHFLPLTHPLLAMATAAIAAGLTGAFSVYEIKVGKRENSPALTADGYHVRTDAIVSLIVFLGLAGRLIHVHTERAATIVVIIFILKAGWEILLESIRVLLDASIDPATLERIRAIIQNHPAITEVREILGRNSGSFTFIEGNLVVKAQDFSHAHQIVERITDDIRRQIPHIDRIVLHYEPARKSTFVLAAMLSDGIRWQVSEHFGEAPYIGWIEIHTGENRIARMQVTANPYAGIERGKGIKLAEHLVNHGVDVILSRQPFHGKGPEYVFNSRDVKVVQISEPFVDENLIARIYHEATGHQLSSDAAGFNTAPPNLSPSYRPAGDS